MKAVRLGAMILPVIAAIAALPASAQQTVVRYQCEQGSGFEATFLRDTEKMKEAKLKLGSQVMTLLPVASSVGHKFSNGRTILFVTENEASIEVNYQTILSRCSTGANAALTDAYKYRYTPD
ncbi:MAG: lysozyme inhibitor [Leptolyngbyaceae cyanobacterium RU_5_1]|nr:lysozyme inhibitor [Leptolyngbyaceae cyanobacterium RU_5_1]